jgi:hypothetical protein
LLGPGHEDSQHYVKVRDAGGVRYVEVRAAGTTEEERAAALTAWAQRGAPRQPIETSSTDESAPALAVRAEQGARRQSSRTPSTEQSEEHMALEKGRGSGLLPKTLGQSGNAHMCDLAMEKSCQSFRQPIEVRSTERAEKHDMALEQSRQSARKPFEMSTAERSQEHDMALEPGHKSSMLPVHLGTPGHQHGAHLETKSIISRADDKRTQVRETQRQAEGPEVCYPPDCLFERCLVTSCA